MPAPSAVNYTWRRRQPLTGAPASQGKWVGTYNPVDIWTITALGMLTVAVQGFIAAAWVVIGGLGGQWRVNQALSRQAQELSRLDERLTRDQKTRAGVARQTEVRERKTLAVEAAERIAAADPPTKQQQRPSTLSAINGGV